MPSRLPQRSVLLARPRRADASTTGVIRFNISGNNKTHFSPRFQSLQLFPELCLFLGFLFLGYLAFVESSEELSTEGDV